MNDPHDDGEITERSRPRGMTRIASEDSDEDESVSPEQINI